MAEDTRHALIGAAVVVSLALLFALSIGGNGAAIGAYRLTAHFTSAEGIFVGSPVRLAGVQVGRVSAMEFDSERQRAVVTMEVAPEVRMPLDSIAIITSEGVLGGRFIRLEPGGELDMLADGDRLDYTQGAVLFEELLAKILVAVEQKRLGRREAAAGNETDGTVREEKQQ